MNNIMDYIHIILNDIQLKMTALLGQAWFANIISLIMGILGTFAFFMQKQRKIKPIVIQYGDIVFIITKRKKRNDSWIVLNSIELNLSISNLRNAVGIIEDIFARVYTTDSYQPETVTYFANKLTIDEKVNDYAPFILNPNSNVTMKVSFGQVEHYRSEKIITVQKNYAIDILFKIKGEKRLSKLKSILTYNRGEIIANKLKLTNISKNIERDKYYRTQKKLYRDTYKGIINYFTLRVSHKIRYYIYYLPKQYFIGIFETIAYFFLFLITNTFAYCISKKIIIFEGKKIRDFGVTEGNKEYRLINYKTLNKIYSYIENFITEMNESLIEENKITLIREKNTFILSRFGNKLNVYSAGDSSIYAQVLERENTINLKFEIKKSKWGIKYWSYEGKFITKYNIAIKILNYFSLYSSVKYRVIE